MIIKMLSYQYSNYYCGGTTILKLSYLHSKISDTGIFCIETVPKSQQPGTQMAPHQLLGPILQKI